MAIGGDLDNPSAGGGGSFNSFTAAGDSGGGQAISDGDTLTIAGGTGITTTDSATDTVTIDIDSTVATLTGTQTLTNKTLTSPKIAALYDNNGSVWLSVTPTASAVNYVSVINAATGGQPYVTAVGADTNISLSLRPKGTGSTIIRSGIDSASVAIFRGVTSGVNRIDFTGAATGNGVSIAANGSDTNVDLLLTGKGTGVVKANGVEVATISGTQTLTNKSLTSPTLTTPKIDAIKDTANNGNILVLTGFASATDYWRIYNAAGSGGASTVVTQAQGSSSTISMRFTPKGAGSFQVYAESGQTATLWGGNADGNGHLNLITQGAGLVKVNGAEVATISGVQTLTNKTLTTPKIDIIKDTNGESALEIAANTSAVNYLKVVNNTTGSNPGIYAVGSDTNIGFGLNGKGSGKIYANGSEIATLSNTVTLTNKTLTSPVINTPQIDYIKDTTYNVNVHRFYSAASAVNYLYTYAHKSGSNPQIGAAGADTNINIDFYAKGTGVVRANGSEIVTLSGTQTLTNKRVTKRVGTTTSSATPTINTDNYDAYSITALATNITSMTTNLSGTPSTGDEIILGFKDDGTPRAITWGSSFVSSGVATLLATTATSKQHWVKLMWDGSHWVCLAVDATGY